MTIKLLTKEERMQMLSELIFIVHNDLIKSTIESFKRGEENALSNVLSLFGKSDVFSTLTNLHMVTHDLESKENSEIGLDDNKITQEDINILIDHLKREAKKHESTEKT